MRLLLVAFRRPVLVICSSSSLPLALVVATLFPLGPVVPSSCLGLIVASFCLGGGALIPALSLVVRAVVSFGAVLLISK